jgi:hypothetical protein
MPRAATKAASLADGPTLASTRDDWILHLPERGKSERTISTLPAGARSARRLPGRAPHLGVEHARCGPQRGRRHAAQRLDRPLDAFALRRVRGC